MPGPLLPAEADTNTPRPVGQQEGDLDGVGDGALAGAADGVVDDVDAVGDSVVDRRDAVGVEATVCGDAWLAGPADLVRRDLGARSHARALAEVVAVDADVGAVVAGCGRGGVRPVALSVPGGEVLALGDVLLPEAVDVVAGADELVVAGRGGEVLAGDALTVPVGGDWDAGAAGEGGALRPDAGVDHADDHPGSGLLRPAELRPEAAGLAQPRNSGE